MSATFARELAQRLQTQQRLHHRQGRFELAGFVQPSGLLMQFVADAGVALLALCLQPDVQLRCVGQAQIAQRLFRVHQVVADTRIELQRRGAAR